MLEYVGRSRSGKAEPCCKCHRLIAPGYGTVYRQIYSNGGYGDDEYVCDSCVSVVDRENAEERWYNSPERRERAARLAAENDRARWDEYYERVAYEEAMEINYRL